MAKFAVHNIKYRPTTRFRSGPGEAYLYTMEDSVVHWWSLESGLIEATAAATYRSGDHENGKGTPALIYSANNKRSSASTDVPSSFIAKSSVKFDNASPEQEAQTEHNVVSFANSSISKGDNPFSIAFWAKGHTGLSLCVPIACSAPLVYSNQPEYSIAFVSGQDPIISIYDQQTLGNSLALQASAAAARLTTSEWKHFIFSYTGAPVFNAAGNTMLHNGLTIYVNGVEQTASLTRTNYNSYQGMLASESNVFTVGDQLGTTTQIFLSDLIVFNKPMDRDSALALYHAKDGVRIRTRSYARKGSTVQMTEGGSPNPFREGVSIRNGEDLSTSIRMKIHSGLNFVKAHSGSAISVDTPFDDGDIPISPPMPGAISRITVSGGAINVGTKINIISTDLTEKTYIGVTEDHATITNGTVLAAGMVFVTDDTISDGDLRIGMIAFMVGSSAADAANMLEIAINHVNGHNGGSRNKKLIIKNNAAGRLDLTQSKQGKAGNTTITITGDNSNRITVLNNGFTGGNNDISSRFTGILDSSRGKTGYTSLLLHEVERRDFGTLNRYQDGTPFNDNVFDSPQKILEDVRTTAGSPSDRHLRVYIGETPNELYNPTDVYDKEARVDIFDRRIDFRETLPDLRDKERDFTRRSIRLTRSGSWTSPARHRGFSGECNCVQITDIRYNDSREASIPFYEFYNDGDISVPLFKKQTERYNLTRDWYYNYSHDNSIGGNYNFSGNLLAWWRLDKNISSAGNLEDSSNNSHTMTAAASANRPSFDTNDTPSTVIQASSCLFATNDFLTAVDTDALSFGNTYYDKPFSISFWLKPTTLDGAEENQAIVSKRHTTGDNAEYLVYIKSEKIRFELYSQGDSAIDANVTTTSDILSAGNWIHIVCTYDGRGGATAATGMSIYVNGALKASTANTDGAYVAMSNTTAPVALGNMASGENTTDLNANLANVAVWNKALSASEAKVIYGVHTASSFCTIDKTQNNKFQHLGRGKIETVLSQSSGPRIEETKPKGKEPYGVYMQSTVNTFYGIAGSDELQGRAFTARYRVASADRPFHDTSKEDLVPTLINISNDADFITEVKTLYMTGSSVHEGGDTGYNLSTTGFQGDLGAHKRDSLAFIGLKRGQ